MNNWGQLGNGERNEEVNAPTHVAFFDDKAVKQAALLQHATLVLCEDGQLYSAGRNSYGQLGRKTEGEFGLKFAPVALPEGVKVQQIACGNHHWHRHRRAGLRVHVGLRRHGAAGQRQVRGRGDDVPREGEGADGGTGARR